MYNRCQFPTYQHETYNRESGRAEVQYKDQSVSLGHEMDDGGRNKAEAGAIALGLWGGGVGGVPKGDHCLLLHPHPHHCQLLGRLLLYIGQRVEINSNGGIFLHLSYKSFFYRLYYDNYRVSLCMLLTVCQHAMWICQHATYIVDKQEK